METVTFRVRSLVWFATGAAVTLLATLVVLQAWRVDAAPGDVDSTFVPMTSCRLMDSRPAPLRVGPNGALSVADTTTLQATGANGNCTIPTDAVGLSMNVTALNATADGFLTFWPSGALPLAASLNPSPGQPPVPNAVTVSLSGTGTFNVYNENGIVDIVIDVNGYYTKTSLSDLAARVTATETGIATNTAGIASLDAREPFAVTARDSFETVTSTDEAVVSVTVTAPAAGRVTINSTTNAQDSTAGDTVLCSINVATATPALNIDHLQQWESAGTEGGRSQMAGTRVFDIAAGEIATYDFVCVSVDTTLRDSVLTAIFTPAP